MIVRKMTPVTIYTDGSSYNGLQSGKRTSAYAAIIFYEGLKITVSGGYYQSTNNRTELMAVIRAVEQLKEPCDITLYSDSQYVVNGINQWLDIWKKKNFKDRKNVDLWCRLIDAVEIHDIFAKWVRGHNGDKFNEECDRICTEIVTGKKKIQFKHDYFFEYFIKQKEEK